jgi:uncharacterized protein (DUF1330 family)
MSVYVIAQIEIHDRDEYKNYIAGFRQMFKGYRGEVLVAENNAVVIEGQWPASRTAVLRFDDEQEMRRWYDSPEYQAAAQHRYKSAKTNLVMVRGLGT